MKQIIFLITLAIMVSGCVSAGLGGSPGQVKCSEGCVTYKPDGTGCKKLIESAPASCLKYFSLVCEISPEQCKNQSLTQ